MKPHWPTRDKRKPDHGYVYVLSFSSGAIKVGHSKNPAGRYDSLRLDAARFGLTVDARWLSPLHTNFEANEVLLIAEGLRIGKKLAREYFLCDFADMVDYGRTLPLSQEPVRIHPPRPVEVRANARQQQVRKMYDQGSTFREIVAALGVSLGTVHNDLKATA